LTSLRRRHAVSVVLVLTALYGCADPTGEPTASPQTPTSTVPESTQPPPSTTESASPTEAPTTGVETRSGLRSALLAPEAMPQLNESTPWQLATTRDDARPSVCQKVALPAVGATRVLQQDYAVADTDITASQVVAEFPDELTAGYGFDIVSSWLRSCGARLKAQGYEQRNVPAAYTPMELGDRAGWAVSFYGPAEQDPSGSHIQAEALVLAGSHLSWLVQHSVGQDYNYEPGESPPERAVSLIADRLSVLEPAT